MNDGLQNENGVILILDEIHELTANGLLILAFLKRNFKKNWKILLMSATMNEYALQSYLCEFTIEKVSIPGKTFGYETVYLEEPCNDFILSALQTLLAIIRNSLEAWTCFHCLADNMPSLFQCLRCSAYRSIHVLVFLPGKKEITTLVSKLQESKIA
jgi:HrpA-like RNA helicase